MAMFQKWQSQQEKEHETLCCDKRKDTLRVCGARRAGGSKTRFMELKTSLLPGLLAPPTRS